GPGAPVQGVIGPGGSGGSPTTGQDYSSFSFVDFASSTDNSLSDAYASVHGIHAESTGSFVVGVVYGNQDVISTYGEAVGIYTHAQVGTSSIQNNGTVYASGQTDAAGIASFAYDSVNIENNGQTEAHAFYGNAYGALGVSD